MVLANAYCSAQDTSMAGLTTSETKQLEECFAMDSEHVIQITNSQEPGRQLTICGTLLNKKNRSPIANQSIYLYQTDNTGEYDRQTKDDVTSARLHGTVTTNKAGRFLVKTILPGDYVTHPNTRHIHTIVRGEQPEGHDFYFKQFAEDYLRSTIENDENNYLIDLKINNDNSLIGFITLEVRG